MTCEEQSNMSHFLCGRFIFEDGLPRATVVEFSFKVVQEACGHHLAVQLGCNIVQPVVFEILGLERASPNNINLPFVITDSPISDTSDDLISPGDFESTLEVGYEILETNLHRVKAFLLSVSEIGAVRAAILCFSEGYDDKYQELDVPLDSFVERCLHVFKEEERVPSLKIRLSF